jgi:UDP-glucose 4-epimerase
MTVAWVIGSHGLLGQALCRMLTRCGSKLFLPLERFNWQDEDRLSVQLSSAVKAFSALIDDVDRWEIYWAAGVGKMSSSFNELMPETRALAYILKLIETDIRLISIPGSVGFASSAGSIYAGSRDFLINESSLIAPTTDYANEKLIQENLVSSFAVAHGDMTSLIARISTLYGTNQSIGKQQGLLTHIARCILKNQSIQIFVPIDTIRDYVAVEDAANTIITALREIKKGVCVKIIASEQPTTIAQIISNFKRIIRRSPRIVISKNNMSEMYLRRMQFKSIVLPECQATHTNLLAGIAQIMAAETAMFQKSKA